MRYEQSGVKIREPREWAQGVMYMGRSQSLENDEVWRTAIYLPLH
jgi:hypothetical protein